MPRLPHLRVLAAAVLAATVIVTAQAPAPASAASPKTRADRVIAIAMAQRGDPWVYGATGPRAFDCSGLVTYAFRRAGELRLIANGRARSGSAMLRWARARGLTTQHGRRGDVVVWGNGSHVGIYLGNGRAISTLVSGVRVHRVRALTTRFTTFIRTGLSAPIRPATAAPTPTPLPSATPAPDPTPAPSATPAPDPTPAPSATPAPDPTPTAAPLAPEAPAPEATTPDPAASPAPTEAPAVTSVATPVPTAAPAPAGPRIVARRTVAVASLNLRTAPRITARIQRALDRGTRLGVVRTSRDATGRTWLRVVVGSRTGWVAGWLTRPAR